MAGRSRQAIVEREIASEHEMLLTYVNRAAVSRDQRRTQNQNLRQWYESGTQDGYAARYNKLQPHLDRLGSYLWSPDAVRFAVHIPPPAREDWLAAAATARDEFRQVWSTSGADLQVSLGLEWALVWGSVPLKIQQDPDRMFVLSAFDPADFGVTREDQPSLEDQDVMCHWYTLSMPQFERWCSGHPREEEFIRKASATASAPPGGSGVTRLVISGMAGAFPNTVVSGSMPGEADDGTYILDASVIEPVVDLVDVWVRRKYRDAMAGEFEDWRVTTALAWSVEPLVRRRNPILPWMRTAAGSVLPAEHPFTMLVPRPQPTYLWGRAELANLLGLQQWRERQVRQMDEVIQRQLDPSKLFIGIADYEEAGRALSTIGGSFGTSEPNAKMDTVQVQVGQEAFAMLQQIDSMFDDQSGIPPVLTGEQPQGVRAGNNLMMVAGIGAGRVRHMALQLEAALSRVATLAFRIMQRGDDQTYTADDGARFLLAQLPAGLSLQVSAHSASPIFQEQIQQKAQALFEAGAIDGPWLVELLDPPYREEMKETAKKLQEARAKNQDQLMQLASARIQRKAERLGPGRPTGS